MTSRWVSLVSMSLVVFACLVLAWQVLHYDQPGEGMVPESCLALSGRKGEQLAKILDLVPRVGSYRPGVASWWTLDLALPQETRVFMADMIGPTNDVKINYYYAATYYLFPREVGVSLDHTIRITQDGLIGRTSEFDEEILASGYDVRLDFDAGEKMHCKTLHEFPTRSPANPEWFDSVSDTGLAFILPLLTALTGMWLLRLLFPGPGAQMPLLEQLAVGLGLGMMAATALALGIKLCGWHGYHLVSLILGAGGIAELWCHRNVYGIGIAGSCRKLVRRPVLIAIFVVASLVFLILFRLAGLQGVVDPDAIVGWLLKAKMMHLYAGKEMLQWFSNPRLADAHLDYPTLVPSLHAITYDSIGHVNEFVTKFWPTWMLLLLLAALAALNRGPKARFYAPYFGLLGVLLLPATQKYVQMEGGVLPMVFFTVLGFVQCALWLAQKDPAPLGLGLTFLFGAAMCKFEGFIFLALLGSWLLLLPSARPPWKLWPRLWRPLLFCLLAALPFVCLRHQIPIVNYESNWAGHILHHPATLLATLADWLRLFGVELARLFVHPDFASWSGEGGRLHWTGQWAGLSSLYNPTTLGLAWLCLLLTVALWFALPSRRVIALWSLVMFLGAVAALSGVFACFANMRGLDAVLGYTADAHGARYLLPMLLAWFATTLTLLFSSQPGSEPIPATSPGEPATQT